MVTTHINAVHTNPRANGAHPELDGLHTRGERDVACRAEEADTERQPGPDNRLEVVQLGDGGPNHVRVEVNLMERLPLVLSGHRPIPANQHGWARVRQPVLDVDGWAELAAVLRYCIRTCGSDGSAHCRRDDVVAAGVDHPMGQLCGWGWASGRGGK